MIALAALVSLLGLGWCLGVREIELEARRRLPPCACKRCWYVGEAPEGMSCPRTSFLSFDGGGVRGMLMVAAIAGLSLLLTKKGRSWLSGWLA